MHSFVEVKNKSWKVANDEDNDYEESDDEIRELSGVVASPDFQEDSEVQKSE